MPETVVSSGLADLHDPQHVQRVRERHCKAYRWEPQNYIPLGIHVADPAHVAGIGYDQWLDPAPFFDAQVKILRDTLLVGSDLMPCLAINHLGEAPVTTMFGAEQFMPEETTGTLQDVGPTPLPVYSCVDEMAAATMPPLDAGIMPEVENMIRYYRERLPQWVYLNPPMPAGPFSTAMELRGTDFLFDIFEHPEPCRRLIEMCARLQAQLYFRQCDLTDSARDLYVTNFGMVGTGLRLGEDSMVNLSPDLIREFVLPAIGLVAQSCGGRGHVHFCSLPPSRFEFIYPVFAESDECAVVSSQFGFEYYAEHLAELRGRLAIEAFYGDAYRYVDETFGSFRDWAMEFVPQFRNEAGLAMYFQVASVEEGRECWAIWQEAHGQ